MRNEPLRRLDRGPRWRGMNRVHAAVSRMRRAGLAELIEHSSRGYRIAALADVVRLPAPDPRP